MNSLSKIAAIFLGVILMFFVPLQDIATKQDSIVQIAVDTETADFVDIIRYNGYISRQMYLEFIRSLENTGNIYDVSICHSHKTAFPNYDDVMDQVTDGYSTVFQNVYEDRILEAFDQGMDYQMDQGDYITVTVVNRNPTLANKIMRALGLHVDSKIATKYGGMIRDEMD